MWGTDKRVGVCDKVAEQLKTAGLGDLSDNMDEKELSNGTDT